MRSKTSSHIVVLISYSIANIAFFIAYLLSFVKLFDLIRMDFLLKAFGAEVFLTDIDCMFFKIISINESEKKH